MSFNRMPSAKVWYIVHNITEKLVVHTVFVNEGKAKEYLADNFHDKSNLSIRFLTVRS